LSYKIKEVFYSIQGEGTHIGRPTIFCRFSGCNLWSGREEDRKKAICNFCDTDFVGTNGEGGGVFETPSSLVTHLKTFWPNCENQNPIVEFTGGEPLLQVDEKLISECKKNDMLLTVETNGTQEVPKGIDWVCFSPKAGSKIIIKKANEIKFVYPQSNFEPDDFNSFNTTSFFIQPKDDDQVHENRKKAVSYCLTNPTWKLSMQIHKILNIK
jgi:7-carboxy-7-deazaguanine synthase